MGKRSLMIIFILWLLWLYTDYLNLFFELGLLVWLGTTLTPVILLVILLYRLYKKPGTVSRIHVYRLLFFTGLLLLTWNSYALEKYLEKPDTMLLTGIRKRIVEQVKRKELKADYYRGLCKLPFNFPVVSDSGNDILIETNAPGDTVTVYFWRNRPLLDNRPTYIVYTNNNLRIAEFEGNIKADPDNCWQIESNWYRVYTTQFRD
ncbi:MAG: hypothetical protein V4543_12025 [Bacteroidota bacterium]